MRALKSPQARNTGVSLIELLVAMAIGLVVTIAITNVMISFDRSKRTSTSVNDASQTSSFVGFSLDRSIRNAGSGFARRSEDAFGCRINARLGGTNILPATTAFPAPFDGITGTALTRRLIPVLIEQNLADSGSEVRGDILSVMAGTAGMGEWPQRVSPTSVTASNFRLPNTLGWRGGDLVLLADKNVAGGCLVEQASAGFTGSASQTLTLNTTTATDVYYAATGSTVNLADFGASSDTFAIQLGNPGLNNPPQFQMFAVGANSILHSLNLLEAATSVPVADGVIEMRALYGLDTDGDRVLNSWQDPGSGGYDAASLTNGSATALTNLRKIVAVRVGLILRSSLRERDVVSGPTTITLFSDLPVALRRTRTLTTEEQHYRYRITEVTVPLRNMLFPL